MHAIDGYIVFFSLRFWVREMLVSRTVAQKIIKCILTTKQINTKSANMPFIFVNICQFH
jgi:hypothetical protein